MISSRTSNVVFPSKSGLYLVQNACSDDHEIPSRETWEAESGTNNIRNIYETNQETLLACLPEAVLAILAVIAAVAAVQKGSELVVLLCGARAAVHAAKDHLAQIMLKHSGMKRSSPSICSSASPVSLFSKGK